MRMIYKPEFSTEDDDIRMGIAGHTDRFYEKFESRDYINMYTIAPMSSRNERIARAVIGIDEPQLHMLLREMQS